LAPSRELAGQAAVPDRDTCNLVVVVGTMIALDTLVGGLVICHCRSVPFRWAVTGSSLRDQPAKAHRKHPVYG
jgi:hypothetical protein